MARPATEARPRIAWVRYLIALAALSPAPAAAGAWIAPEGGQEIWTNVVGERDEVPFYETSAYWKLPGGENNSFVAAPWFEQNFDTDDGWRGEAILGFKQTLHRGETRPSPFRAALWISHPGLDETRALDEGCGGARLDLNAGYRPNDDWLVMGQLFLDAPREGGESLEAQFTLVRFGESGRGLQIGLRPRIDDGAQEPALVIGVWGRPGN